MRPAHSEAGAGSPILPGTDRCIAGVVSLETLEQTAAMTSAGGADRGDAPNASELIARSSATTSGLRPFVRTGTTDRVREQAKRQANSETLH